MTKKIEAKYKGFFWHIHHNILAEWSNDINERVKAIKDTKPKNEIPIRLKLLKKVKGKLPKEFIEAYKALDKAYKAWDKAYKAWEKSWNSKQLIELHNKECGCKEWNGKEIVFE